MLRMIRLNNKPIFPHPGLGRCMGSGYLHSIVWSPRSENFVPKVLTWEELPAKTAFNPEKVTFTVSPFLSFGLGKGIESCCLLPISCILMANNDSNDGMWPLNNHKGAWLGNWTQDLKISRPKLYSHSTNLQQLPFAICHSHLLCK